MWQRNVESALALWDGVAPEAFELSIESKQALFFLNQLLIDYPPFVVFNYELHAGGAEWNELTKYAGHGTNFLMSFAFFCGPLR